MRISMTYSATPLELQPWDGINTIYGVGIVVEGVWCWGILVDRQLRSSVGEGSGASNYQGVEALWTLVLAQKRRPIWETKLH